MKKLTVRQFADITGVTVQNLYGLVRWHELTSAKSESGHLMIVLDDLAVEYMARHSVSEETILQLCEPTQ